MIGGPRDHIRPLRRHTEGSSLPLGIGKKSRNGSGTRPGNRWPTRCWAFTMFMPSSMGLVPRGDIRAERVTCLDQHGSTLGIGDAAHCHAALRGVSAV
jgi:hypothetical protein